MISQTDTMKYGRWETAPLPGFTQTTLEDWMLWDSLQSIVNVYSSLYKYIYKLLIFPIC